MRLFFIIMLLVLVAGCATSPEVFQQDSYVSIPKQHLRDLKRWKFEGRMAITSKDDSWSANVKWQHKPGLDKIGLSGLLGQGATLIALADDWVTIDDGKGPIEQSNDPDAFVSEHLGVFVPVQALASWVVGLPSNKIKEELTAQGFDQNGWQVVYKEWQKINNAVLPHKVNVKNDQVRLKLVIEQWELSDD